jgi:hypothetical protein
MKRWQWKWIAVVVMFASATTWLRAPAQVQSPQPSLPEATAGGSQMLTNLQQSGQTVIYDSQRQTLAVYQIEPQTGMITLKSVRRIAWDLQLTDFNTSNPLPQDIRNGLNNLP